MKGRDGRASGAPAGDLLVCFPTPAHLTLTPKPMGSPARAAAAAGSETQNHRSRQQQRSNRRQQQQMRRSGTSRRGRASPLMRGRSKAGAENDGIAEEPSSPKVTCAGKIKVRKAGAAAAGSCENKWQSVMEEIERIHSRAGKQKRRPGWTETLRFKKEIVQFLTCLRNLRFDFPCFRSFPGPDLTSDDCDEEEAEPRFHRAATPVDSASAFAKWFMVLQENQQHPGGEEPEAPPPNALLRMRCRSAPGAKGWAEKSDGGDRKEDDNNETEEGKMGKSMAMGYHPGSRPVSSHVAKETWIVGAADPFSRSRSWKR